MCFVLYAKNKADYCTQLVLFMLCKFMTHFLSLSMEVNKEVGLLK